MTRPDCPVGRCPRQVELTVRFPQSGRYDYCGWHGRPHLQYAEPYEDTFADPGF